MSKYENTRRVMYESGAQFIPICEKCGRYVKAPDTIQLKSELLEEKTPNCKCSKCGDSRMIFEGFIG